MCDCVQSSLILPNGGSKFRKSGQIGCNSKLAFPPLAGTTIAFRDSSAIAKLTCLDAKNLRVCGKREKSLMNMKLCLILGVFDSDGSDFGSELRLKEEKDEKFEMGLQNGRDKMNDLIRESEADALGMKNLKREKQQNPEYEGLREDEGGLKGENLIGIENGKSEELKEKEGVQLQPKKKQLMKRSSLIAKQVIGIQSARSYGFVSQLWVDAASWVVLELEVRPNLLSSESGKFLFDDIKQIGDVVLVPDDRIMLNEFRTVGLESLVLCFVAFIVWVMDSSTSKSLAYKLQVGYNVVTPGQGHLGKVRGYTFNINSGVVESLELDAFGYAIIPSSLVSTYALSTEDIMEVLFDTVIVHEAAASRIRRLTKGFLGTKNMGISSINLPYSDLEGEEPKQRVKGRKPRRKSNKQKSHRGMGDLDDELVLPMDYM